MTKTTKHIDEFATDEELAQAYESGVTIDLGNLKEHTQEELLGYYNRIKRAYRISMEKQGRVFNMDHFVGEKKVIDDTDEMVVSTFIVK